MPRYKCPRRPAVLPAVLLCAALLPGGAGRALAADPTPGEAFHSRTKHSRAGVLLSIFKSKPSSPGLYKTYPGAAKVKLPKPAPGKGTLRDALDRRRSIRNYSAKPISLEELSSLLFAASGKTGSAFGVPLRTAPSAGALYPVELYVLAPRVDGLEPGLYHYTVRDHGLEAVKKGDFTKPARKASLDQEMVEDAPVTFVLSAIFDRVRSKYGERGYRYAYMEAGHISQNIYLQAASMGLGSVSMGAFLDDDWNMLLGVDGVKEAVVYLHSVGRPR